MPPNRESMQAAVHHYQFAVPNRDRQRFCFRLVNRNRSGRCMSRKLRIGRQPCGCRPPEDRAMTDQQGFTALSSGRTTTASRRRKRALADPGLAYVVIERGDLEEQSARERDPHRARHRRAVRSRLLRRTTEPSATYSSLPELSLLWLYKPDVATTLGSSAAAAAETFACRGPVFEFGSFIVPGQEAIGDLRPLRRVRVRGLRHAAGPGVDRVEDLGGLTLPDESVGTIVCVETLEHRFEVRKAVEEMLRVLCPAACC